MAETRDAMTLVATLFAAVNSQQPERVRACYRADRRQLADEWRPGEKYDVTRIGGIQTGWGWVRADWTRGVNREAGYTYFWIEDGVILRQRTVLGATAAPSPRPKERPVTGVGAVIFNARGEVLLVKRRHEPLALQWSLPGGGLEFGETLPAGTAREVREETGLDVEVGPLVEVFDRILLDEQENVRYHFVLVDFLCRPIGGTLSAGSDVSECAWAARERLDEFQLAGKPRDVIDLAWKLKESLPW